jgi:hypothetical protein
MLRMRPGQDTLEVVPAEELENVLLQGFQQVRDFR